MKPLIFLAAVGALGVFAYWVWHWRRRWRERQRAGEERFASFMAQTLTPASASAPRSQRAPEVAALATQKLLLEAAAKAGEAGEPALSIQLYARLLSRYPETSYASQARAAVEMQKKKLQSPRAPGTAAPG
jgi:hypothetical protein